MKLLKLFLFVFGIGMFFGACEQYGLDSNLEVNEESISSLARSVSTDDVSRFAPVGVIPEWAQEKMSPEEYELWKIMSSQFKVDYSFLKTRYYALNKASITAKIRHICVSICGGEIPESEYGIPFSVIPPEESDVNLFHGVERLSDPEGPIGQDQTIKYTIYSNGSVSMEFTLIYIRLSYEGMIQELSSSFDCRPSTASFHGSKSHRIDVNGYVHISCIGYISNGAREYDVNYSENHLLR